MTHRIASLRSWAFFSLAAIFLALLAPGIASARRPTCPPATYILHQQLGDPAASRARTITLERAQLSINGVCPATKVRLRGSRKGTRLSAKWDSCPGLTGRHVALIAKIDPSCGTFLGTLKIKKPKFKGVVIATKAVGESLRIGTYNIQALPSMLNGGTSKKKAKRIANRIVASGYDVIVLNEVFDEDIRDVLRKKLKGAYPYYVAKLAGGTVTAEDSGLALYSRLPFEDPVVGLYEPGDCEGSNCSRVRFVEFSACDGFAECHAEKGVGYARLKNPDTGSIYNFVFTHTQASDWHDDRADAGDVVSARGTQLGTIAGLLHNLQNMAFGWLFQEPIFILGDLNVDGDLDNPDVIDNGEVAWEVENIHEWREFFDKPGVFWHDTLRDSWAFDNAPKPPVGIYDRGLTNRGAWGPGSKGSRLDYILHNVNATRLCIQHMTLAHNLRWSKPNGVWTESGIGPNSIGLAGVQKLSDHVGLNADINLAAAHCRPVDAEVVTPTPGEPQTLPGSLLYPGSIQWFRFDEDGTYSFAMDSSNGTDLRVYEADDLSTPVSQYKKQTTTIQFDVGPSIEAKVFHIPTPPFYVRVFNPDRAETGPYTLIALKHDCSSKEMACALGPVESRELTMSTNPPVNSPDEAWFVLTPEALPNGLTQHVKVDLDIVDPAGAAAFHLDVEDDNGGLLGQSLTGEPFLGTMRFRTELDESSGAPIYLVARRQPAGSLTPPYPDAARHITVIWYTNLSILYGSGNGGDALELWCHIPNDNSVWPVPPTDEVKLDWVKADGSKVAGSKYIQDFSEGDSASLELMVKLPIYFLDNVVFRFRELDSADSGADDLIKATIQPLEEGWPGAAPGREAVLDWEGGLYSLYYNLAHGFDK